MKKNWLLLLFIFFVSLLEATVFSHLMLFRTKPDLLLAMVVIMAITLKPNQALLFSLASGIFKYMFGAGVFGIYILLFPLWCFLIIKLSRKISLDNDIAGIVLIFFVDILQNIFIRLGLLFAGIYITWYVFLKIIFLEAVYTTVMSPFILKSYKFFKLHIKYK
ncbi:MAG: rod shape-determining protein MreD [Candidatus Omnitrophota bacterium]